MLDCLGYILTWLRAGEKTVSVKLKLSMFTLCGVLAPEPSWTLTWHKYEHGGSKKVTLTLATSTSLNTFYGNEDLRDLWICSFGGL